MSMFVFWVIYGVITAVLAALAFKLPQHAQGPVKWIQSVASVLVVLVGITFVVLTAVLVLDFVAPNSGGTDGGEQCIPDPWGGC